jgi:O-antigen/teichoic acid export membrane protein
MAVSNLATSSSSTVVSGDFLHSLRGRAMARNTIWNIFGQLLPLALAAVAIPLLIRRLGVDRFGVLTLAWTIVGYFGLFDLGLGRAITKVVSEALAKGRQADASGAVWTGSAILFALGTLFTLALFFISHLLVYRWIKVPVALQEETVKAVHWLAISIPIVTVTAGLRGVLEAQHRFGALNLVRVVMGVFSYLGPLIAAAFSPDLQLLCAVLVIGRTIGALVYLMLCLSSLPSLRRGVTVRRDIISVLVDVGAWITVSNTIGPIVTYGERFLIGLFLSVAAVAYYATPSELVLRLLLVPAAISTVLFPAFAALSVVDSSRLALTYDRGIRFCFILIFPAIFLIVLFAPEGLRLWLGPVFAEKSTLLLRWIALGIFVNSLSQIPYALLQAANRPDLPGKLFLIDAPIYLFALVEAIKMYGITGAAVVWSVRLIFEGYLLLVFADRTLVRNSLKLPSVLILSGVGVLGVSTVLSSGWPKAVWCILVLLGGAVIAWRILLRQEERSQLRLLLPQSIAGNS